MEKYSYFYFVNEHIQEKDKIALLEDKRDILGLVKIVLNNQSQPIKDKLTNSLFRVIKQIDNALQ